MLGKKIKDLDTPALLIDLNKMDENLIRMQNIANDAGVKLRPHIKTHKSAEIAHLQLQYGAIGITVAKTSEAEAMAKHGINNIFIASEVVGKQKMERIRSLSERVHLRLAVDSLYQVEQLVKVFDNVLRIPVELMVEIDTGLKRCGVQPRQEAVDLVAEIKSRFPQTTVRGIFTHEGMAYHAENRNHVKEIAHHAQLEMIETGKQIEEELGISCEISIGCTIALLAGGVLPGITEIRPGTYVFYDSQYAQFMGHTNYCAATILSTITSKQNQERIVADAGAKSFTIDKKEHGVCKTTGFGIVKDHPTLFIQRLSDEHATITPGTDLQIGDRIQIIPNHICPTVNLYNMGYGIRDGIVEKIFTITARGCTK